MWGEAAERRRAFEAILTGWETGRPELRAAVGRVDEAIVAGLRALGLPRGVVREVRIESAGWGWVGRKHPDCSLVLDGEAIQDLIRLYDQPDTVFRTWVHESLHARQRHAVSPDTESRSVRGYEEGLVEGLARRITRDKAGMNPLEPSYDYYVQAYRCLARLLGDDVEQLWRELWRFPTGQVRLEFVGVVLGRLRRISGYAMTAIQRSRLQVVADRFFSTSRLWDQPDEGTMIQVWRSVFR